MSTQTTILHSQLSRSALNPSEEAHQPPSSQSTLVKAAKIAALILMPVAALAFLPTPFAIATVAISVFF